MAGRVAAVLTKALKLGHYGPNDRLGKFFFLGGIVLPILAVVFECTTHFCASHFFDPFPSAAHVILFLLIPFTNFLAWLTQYKDLSQHYAFMSLATGMAAGIGIMYSLMFLPILGLSLIFALVGGFGLLGLSPALALPCTLRSEKRVSKLAVAKSIYCDPHQLNHIGHLVILVMIVAIELPSTLTRINLSEAASPLTSADGVKWLRKYGNRETMLRACYERSGRATDIIGSLYESTNPVSIDDARNIFYKVTGVPFNSVPLPASARATIRKAGLVQDSAGVNAAVEDEFDLDMDIASEVISGIARGLSVTDNEIKADIDPDALLGKMDWKIMILNSSKYDREARAKLLIPRDSVVTRATLVVDGIERDATIMVRGQARKTYVQSAKSLVRRKDPLLVSTCGPDEILVQCFPIKPNNFAEIKLEIVCPMQLEANDDAALGLPTIVEKNFLQEQPAKVILNSKRPAHLSGIIAAESKSSNSEQSTQLVTMNSLNGLAAVIHAERDRNIHTVFCHDTFANPSHVVEQNISHAQRKEPIWLDIIVDGSAVMQPHIDDIIAGLKELPASVPVHQITVVGDISKPLLPQPTIVIEGYKHKPLLMALILPGKITQINQHTGPTYSSSGPAFAAALEALKKFQFVAGQDDSSALMSDVREDASHTSRAVLWIHAAQPVHKERKDDLRHILKNNKNSFVLYDFTVCAGPQEMLEGTVPGRSLVMVPRTQSVHSDLQNLFKSWRKDPKTDTNNEFRQVNNDEPLGGAYMTNSSLAQVAAYRELLSDMEKGSSYEAPANFLAQKYHLVSPTSSAIVNNVPVVEEKTVGTAVAPEADTWLLLIVAFGIISFGIYQQKRTPRSSIA
ncbi:MAG: hypothetical protein JST89_00715 [Cyanobacteria bacterium SZAS-4]|nr:hypothetical protein [Cyanobacteria bacterium SZAS-4]